MVLTCQTPGVYREALTRGSHYEALEHDPAGARYRLTGDNGRTRWFPADHFIAGKVDIPRVAEIEIGDDPADWERTIVEVTVTLTSGAQRLCHFATPATVLSAGPFVGETKVRYQAGVIVAAEISEAIIREIIRELDEQGDLARCAVELTDPE